MGKIGYYEVMAVLSSRVKEAIKGKDRDMYLSIASNELEKAYKQGEVSDFNYLHLNASDLIRGLIV